MGLDTCIYLRGRRAALGMTEYRRFRVAGGTYFFTVNLAGRRSDLLVQEIETLREVVQVVKAANPFFIDAWVVLPEHMHCVWTLPDGDADFSKRWQAIKMYFSKRLPSREFRSCSRAAKHERGIWQRRFWEHSIRDEQDYRKHLDYVHFNPVKHGLVTDVARWPYSSFHQCAANGMYPVSGAGGGTELADAGERS